MREEAGNKSSGTEDPYVKEGSKGRGIGRGIGIGGSWDWGGRGIGMGGGSWHWRWGIVALAVLAAPANLLPFAAI